MSFCKNSSYCFFCIAFVFLQNQKQKPKIRFLKKLQTLNCQNLPAENLTLWANIVNWYFPHFFQGAQYKYEMKDIVFSAIIKLYTPVYWSSVGRYSHQIEIRCKNVKVLNWMLYVVFGIYCVCVFVTVCFDLISEIRILWRRI